MIAARFPFLIAHLFVRDVDRNGFASQSVRTLR